MGNLETPSDRLIDIRIEEERKAIDLKLERNWVNLNSAEILLSSRLTRCGRLAFTEAEMETLEMRAGGSLDKVASWSSSRSESFTECLTESSLSTRSSQESQDQMSTFCSSPEHSQDFVRIMSPSRQRKESVSRRDLMRALKRIGIPAKLKKAKEDKYRRKVVLNGEPLADELVKKAEEFAGPIHPGNFWYDKQAGFWGVESGPCLGMIPPFIEEFDQPLSSDCSGGDTNVFVNGRELHYKDLERLSTRGLSKVPGCAYRIWSDGRVVEDTTGRYLKGLGMLAPSVAKGRRGDGLYIPISYQS